MTHNPDDQHPVDSTTRTCCGGIGRHTPDCREKGHECRFAWCISAQGKYLAAELEHFSNVYVVPATAEIRERTARDGEVPVVEASIWFQEDLEAAPDIHLSVAGDAVDLRIEEAVLLAEGLRKLVNAAIAGTKMDPARIVEKLDESDASEVMQ